MDLDAIRILIQSEGMLLESAKGPIPNLAEAIAGEPIQGSWWGHPAGNRIHSILEDIRRDDDVVVLRLVRGKLTYVHRRLWPALARMADELTRRQLASIISVHTERGHHEVREVPLAEWLPDECRQAAQDLDLDSARQSLASAFVAC